MARTRTSAGDTSFRLGTGAFALVLIGIVVAIGVVLWMQSRPSLAEFGFRFWRTETWDPVSGEFGALPFIWGTFYSSILALALATPVALGIAVFVSHACPPRWRPALVFLTELLAAIPSIVYGLWGFLVLVPYLREFQMALPDAIRALPLFAGPAVGVSLLSASVVLAIMIVPFTSSIAREVLNAVPPSQREAAYAIGATDWEATKVALHYARVGIIGAVMLGFGRALGETMAVTMVIGNQPKVAASVFAPQYTMAAVIANEITEAGDALHFSALVEIGLVLFFITLCVNVASRFLLWSMTRQRTRPSLTAVVSAEESAA